MKLTPLKINLLLHIYALAKPFNHPDAPAYIEAKSDFVLNELACRDDAACCGYRLTPRGKALIKMLLATPLPEQSGWIDPRTNKLIG